LYYSHTVTIYQNCIIPFLTEKFLQISKNRFIIAKVDKDRLNTQKSYLTFFTTKYGQQAEEQIVNENNKDLHLLIQVNNIITLINKGNRTQTTILYCLDSKYENQNPTFRLTMGKTEAPLRNN